MWDFYSVRRISASRYGRTDRGMGAGFARSSVLKIPEMRWNLQLHWPVKREVRVFWADLPLERQVKSG
jgi:hypothetical protein